MGIIYQVINPEKMERFDPDANNYQGKQDGFTYGGPVLIALGVLMTGPWCGDHIRIVNDARQDEAFDDAREKYRDITKKAMEAAAPFINHFKTITRGG